MSTTKGPGLLQYLRLPSQLGLSQSRKSSESTDEAYHGYPLSDRGLQYGNVEQQSGQPYATAYGKSQTQTTPTSRRSTSRSSALLECFLHLLPLLATIAVILINSLGIYWQDLGLPNQKFILQALQYAAKIHEIMMIASLSTIILHRVQSDLETNAGISFGLLAGGFRLNSPLYLLTKQFWGGITARVQNQGMRRFVPLSALLLAGFALTLVLGPSSAVAIIPRLDWWDVPTDKSFGLQYSDHVFFNRTENELWPSVITNSIYSNLSDCDPNHGENLDCAVSALVPVRDWIKGHSTKGLKPNITIFDNNEITRYLSSQGGPPDNSSWTVSSTIPSVFARDMVHYWDWLVENSTLPKNVNRPRIRPHFTDPAMKVKKPLVQVQCHTYLEPEWEHDSFAFPHDELLTPPLDQFRSSTWTLPNAFVLKLLGNNTNIGDLDDDLHPNILFDWFNTASNFSSAGSPSLGAVTIFKTNNGTADLDALGVCSFDSRWAEAKIYLDPWDTMTIYQDTPKPMDLLNDTHKANVSDLIRMELSLEWANSMNVQLDDENPKPTSIIENMLEYFGNHSIYPEPEPFLGYQTKSLDWRLSTALGLYVTEGLAHAFQDFTKDSILYRKAHDPRMSYIRFLNDINNPMLKRFYKDGKLDWTEMRDPLWKDSIPPWDEWAPQNGYREIAFTVQRNGYGYGFGGLPIKLATVVLGIYVLVVILYMVTVLATGSIRKGYDDMGQVLALAWSSAPSQTYMYQPKGITDIGIWKQQVRVEDDGHDLRLLDDGAFDTAMK